MPSQFVLYRSLILMVLGASIASATPPVVTQDTTEEAENHRGKPAWEADFLLEPTREDTIQGCQVSVSDHAAFYPSMVHRPIVLSRWWHERVKPQKQYSHWGYPEFFEEMPLGSSVRAHMCSQIAMGLKERLVLYRYDFHENSTSLNRSGRQRLNDLAGAFPHWANDRLVIEATPEHPSLAFARRDHVRELLEEHQLPARVEVDVPRIRMLQGEEAILINQHFLRQVQSGSSSMQTGGGLRSANVNRQPTPSNESFR